MDGETVRRSGSIILQSESREDVIRWQFHEGWPSKWEGPVLNATGNEVAIETFEIACEGITVEWD